MNILSYVDIIEDLNLDISASERYERMIKAIECSFLERNIHCDALALLKLDEDSLRPVAVLGLKPEALARHFKIEQHPRLAVILQNRQATRFEADSTLPDPYDGLVDAEHVHLEVHDCMGSTIYIDNQIWGVLTFDALSAGSFDHLDPMEIRADIAALSAAIKTSQHIERLKLNAEHHHEMSRRLVDVTPELIGSSAVLQAMQNEINTVAPTNLSVLITGETGVGKELVARSIHQYSQRAEQPLVKVNCAALPQNIVESELFGHLRGAFSGASSDRSGRFELADGGSLFLDEVGELPLAIQAKLLRALQSGEIQRVGSDNPIVVDVRIIAATNRDLQREVKEGRFRADLYHRLSVYFLPVPPLRERDNDCELLAGFFLEKNQHQLGVNRLRLSAQACLELQNYDWPGNVRELEHLLSRASLKAIREQGRTSKIITISNHHLDLQLNLNINDPLIRSTGSATPEPDRKNFRQQVDHFQRQLIKEQLDYHNGKLTIVGRALEMDRSNLVRTMKRLGI